MAGENERRKPEYPCFSLMNFNDLALSYGVM